GEAGCPVRMGDFSVGPICGRKLHIAPDGVDSTPVCLMHSKDPDKQSGPLFDHFRFEFERTLKAAGQGIANFEGFIFPKLNLPEREFQAHCCFKDVTFTQSVDFRRYVFMQDTIFRRASYKKKALYSRTTFKGKID